MDEEAPPPPAPQAPVMIQKKRRASKNMTAALLDECQYAPPQWKVSAKNIVTAMSNKRAVTQREDEMRELLMSEFDNKD